MLLASRLRLSELEVQEMNELIAQIDDWEKAVRLIIARQAGPFLYNKLPLLSNKSLVPQSAIEALRQSHLKTLSRNMVLAAHFGQVATAFYNENIPVIAMKGIYLSDWLYKDLSFRQSSDIDLLVKAEDGERALEVMRRLGYHSEELELPPDIIQTLMPVHYPAMIRNGVAVEIHTRLHSSLSDYEVDIENLWDESVEIQTHGVMTRVFRLEHLLITLIQHLDKHFSNSKFQFTGFYDISNLLDLYGAAMDVSYIQSTAEAWKLKSMVEDYCTLAHRYFKVSVPENLLILQPTLKLEDVFLKSLTDAIVKVNFSLTNYQSIRLFNSPSQKISYIVRMTFPRPAYLMQQYKFTNKLLLVYYYPYRFLSLMKTAVTVVGQKIGNELGRNK